ncbi:unnamed protein product [Mytilus coruscus]|uniref:CCHC-type domain-containing protein n=1 Tax=Mytilus coruscus TaxID=42192 RepID=A0A6J8EXK6_MYTCO|nr:unnamed protein product [Mytilus coruscus]
MSGRYEDHPEEHQEYSVPHVRATMAPERAPASVWKAELEKTDRKFDQKLCQVYVKLDDILDQFNKLLARSPSPGGQAGPGDCYHCGERGHFKRECPKFRGEGYNCYFHGSVEQNCNGSMEGRAEIESEQSSNSDEEATPSGGFDHYLLKKTLAYILMHGALKLGNKPSLLCYPSFTSRFGLGTGLGQLSCSSSAQRGPGGSSSHIERERIGAILAIEENHRLHKVAAPTETTLASDEEAQESWDSTSDGEADTTLVEDGQ